MVLEREVSNVAGGGGDKGNVTLCMSKLPPEAVKEFAELYKQEYGIELDPTEAAVRARNFLNLYAAVLGEFGSTDTTGNE